MIRLCWSVIKLWNIWSAMFVYLKSELWCRRRWWAVPGKWRRCSAGEPVDPASWPRPHPRSEDCFWTGTHKRKNLRAEPSFKQYNNILDLLIWLLTQRFKNKWNMKTKQNIKNWKKDWMDWIKSFCVYIWGLTLSHFNTRISKSNLYHCCSGTSFLYNLLVFSSNHLHIKSDSMWKHVCTAWWCHYHLSW